MHNTNENLTYLKQLLGEDAIDTYFRVKAHKYSFPKDSKEYDVYNTVSKCLDQMEKAGDNRWWLSTDKKVLAYYQFMNKILLVPFGKFHEALEYLLDRGVWIHELGLDYDKLKEEVEKAYHTRA